MILLSKDQIEKIYNEQMVIDFPQNELRPLRMINDLISKGRYECYGLMENDEIIGYSFLNRLEGSEDYLIDYLGIVPFRRNCGCGAKTIQLLTQKLSEADSIIGEVEDPKYAEVETDKELQTRRFNFYLRNGFRDTTVRTICFGVPYIVIELGNKKTDEEIKDLYRQHYKSMLPKELFEANFLL